jgi:adenylate kinase family enzyme
VSPPDDAGDAAWPQRVMVIGSSGAGKSQLGRRLAGALDLPLTDLDDEHWQAGWVEPPEDWWRERNRQLAAGEQWVIEGNYGSTIDIRAARTDLVVLFDLPRLLCVWRVIVRMFKTRFGRQIWRLPKHCQANPDWEPLRDFPEFLRYIWRFPAASLPRALARLDTAGVERLVVLRSTAEVRALTTTLTSRDRASEALRASEEPLASVMAARG